VCWALKPRIDYGLGYRVYYAKVGRRLVMLLVGVTKKRQQADIEQAKAFLADHRRRARIAVIKATGIHFHDLTHHTS